MSKSIELTNEQFNTLITVLSSASLSYGQSLEGQGTYAFMIGVKAAKEDVDDIITALTADEPPGVKIVDEAKSIVRKGKDE